MRTFDLLHFSVQALVRTRFRSMMLLLAMSVGVASVVILTGLGEGARQFVLGEFAALGKDVLILLPGHKETTGGLPPITGGALRDITLEDVAAIRQLPGVTDVAPIVIGSVRASHGGASREAIVMGTTAGYFRIRNLQVRQGVSFPDQNSERGGIAILGQELRGELFRGKSFLGQWLRIGDNRFRIIGVLQQGGGAFGMDISNLVFIPVQGALSLFNSSGLFRVMVQMSVDADVIDLTNRIEILMQARHQGDLDITVISPDALLASFDDILVIMTMAVSAIGGISLLVAGILIMNVMLISITQRTREIGLLKALGASAHRIRLIFVTEALLLALCGALLGVGLGLGAIITARELYPEIAFRAPLWSVMSAVLTAVIVSILFSWLPARRAAHMEPLAALVSR
ncbi:MAG: putative ABC transport system permease protein [Parasphingorhabdus sp.]|jgi:putative ABC transport system permease protein